MENEKFCQRLSEIQAELKAPKGQYNEFGKYSYRSCEDILEAVKPLLAKRQLVLTITDELTMIGNRYYVKATARIEDELNYGNAVSVSAYAREAESKKGMDESQITGSASSYARKYALNGLLLIDDTRDADTRDNKEDKPAPKAEELASDLPDTEVNNAEDYACSDCNAELKQGVFQYSLNHYGRPLCFSCQKKHPKTKKEVAEAMK